MTLCKDFLKDARGGVGAALFGFYVEAIRTGGGVSIRATGIIGVSELTKNEILLLSHKAKLRVFGEKLVLLTFDSKVVEIRGKIRSVEFIYGKN